MKLVFEEHICRINHKETSMTLSTTSIIWRETSRALYLPRMTSPEVAIAFYVFAQPRFKPIGEGENFHSCNKRNYFLIFEIHFLILEDHFLILENDFLILENTDFLSTMACHIICFVSFRFVSFRFCFVSFRFVSFRFDLFRFVSICFVSFRSVSFRSVSFLFRFALYRDPRLSNWHSLMSYRKYRLKIPHRSDVLLQKINNHLR